MVVMRHAFPDIMTKITFLSIVTFVTLFVKGQNINLTDHTIFPRLDSSSWMRDFDQLNSNYSNAANRCQTCVFNQTDSTRGRFCFNTSQGHVKMDTVLHNFSADKLPGKWTVVKYGEIEVSDSVLADEPIYFRSSKTVNEQSGDNGFIIFTNKRIQFNIKNISAFPRRKSFRYRLLDGKYLTTLKALNGYCGATLIGLTNDEYLLLDDLTYRTRVLRGKYMIVKTTIRRLILKKSTTA